MDGRDPAEADSQFSVPHVIMIVQCASTSLPPHPGDADERGAKRAGEIQ
jgi:hypothetical protein